MSFQILILHWPAVYGSDPLTLICEALWEQDFDPRPCSPRQRPVVPARVQKDVGYCGQLSLVAGARTSKVNHLVRH